MSITLPTEKTSGKATLSLIRLLLYANAKTGKTTVCSGFPNNLFISTEKQSDNFKIYNVYVHTWTEFCDVVGLLLIKKQMYQYITIDTVDELCRMLDEHVCELLAVDHISDAEWSKGYDTFKKEFDRLLNMLFMSNYGIILTSHTKTVEKKTKVGTYTQTVVSLKNYVRNVLLPKVNSVGYMKTVTYKEGEQFYEKRVITFNPSEFEEAGDQDGALDGIEIESFEDPEETYQEFVKAYEKAANK